MAKKEKILQLNLGDRRMWVTIVLAFFIAITVSTQNLANDNIKLGTTILYWAFFVGSIIAIFSYFKSSEELRKYYSQTKKKRK